MAARDPQPDYAAVTEMQQQTWAAGDFGIVARSIVPVSEALVAAADPHAGQRVLDVACGSGNVALVAARRYCEVTGLDYVPALLERGRQRALAEGLQIRFELGDAQALPFADHIFDSVLSTFGVMFAPDQAKAASELVRVCRAGGTIGLASWTPEGAVGEFFRCIAGYRPPPPGLASPLRWGTVEGLRELFGPHIRALRTEQRLATQYYRSVEHAVEVFRTYFGPTERAFQALDGEGQQALATELATLFRSRNHATDGTAAMSFEYLEAIVTT